MYCQRGDMENRLKEQQLALFADRTSSTKWWTNQFRVLLAALAYTVLDAIHRASRDALGPGAVPDTSVAAAQDRRRGDAQHPSCRASALQLLPRPSGVPTARAVAHRRIIPTARTQRPRTDPGNNPERRPTLPHLQAARTVLPVPPRAAQNAARHHPSLRDRRKPTGNTSNTTQKMKTNAFTKYAGSVANTPGLSGAGENRAQTSGSGRFRSRQARRYLPAKRCGEKRFFGRTSPPPTNLIGCVGNAPAPASTGRESAR